MSADASLEFALPRILQDLGEGAEPDYVDDLLARTEQLPQRRVFGVGPRSRIPWQLLAAAALVALAAAAAALVVGNRRTETAPLTGPAGNGQIAYFDWKGDLFLGNPRDGSSALLVDNAEMGTNAVFSPDGSRIAFIGGLIKQPQLTVVRADGSDLQALGYTTDEPRQDVPLRTGSIWWTADSSSIIYGRGDRGFQLFDLAAGGQPRAISGADARALQYGTVRYPAVSPSGDDELLYDEGAGLIAVRTSGGAITQIVGPSSGLTHVGAPAWSPDGSLVMFQAGELPTGGGGRVFVIRRDGAGLRQLSREESFGAGDGDAAAQWSPDGSFIAAERVISSNIRLSEQRREHLPGAFSELVIFDVDSGQERPVADTQIGTIHTWWTWSPDGQSLLVLGLASSPLQLVDAKTGRVTELPWAPRTAPSWQRIAVH